MYASEDGIRTCMCAADVCSCYRDLKEHFIYAQTKWVIPQLLSKFIPSFLSTIAVYLSSFDCDPYRI